ncbi:sterol esterase [Microdochium trichocladiopsis]|uniref:Sterol esterase n=1 Tax=Microdochium trichocladiopsis TaxID=1682393 RepID=A0A9P8YEB6_9PEZI|nr:sterol esterase [Microdochium trichocladiopsis]KAH7035381.1 sterol esterase [Microdochium trichocladiopsis]
MNGTMQLGSQPSGSSTAAAAIDYAHQSEKLSHQLSHDKEHPESVAVEARFVTPQDPVIVTADGHRLPGVPLPEAYKLNALKAALDKERSPVRRRSRSQSTGHLKKVKEATNQKLQGRRGRKPSEAALGASSPPSHTNPLFPPLPLYGPPSLLRDIQCMTFRVSAFFLSAAFLAVIVLGALFTSIPPLCLRIWSRLKLQDPDTKRPFHQEELRRSRTRAEENEAWVKQKAAREGATNGTSDEKGTPQTSSSNFTPTEGGPDPIVCDPAYYARRVGLDIEEIQVQTEDGFIIDLWHVYDPREYTKLDDEERGYRTPDPFTGSKRKRLRNPNQKPKFPVLLMHGLLQSSGAYCVNDDDSLAFYLCKAGYDVFLGNNRCGFKPRHVLLEYSDPRMWAWNIRQMGVYDLAALTSRVLFETGFDKIGLICHSQGTTQTFVALAKEQRPDLGEKLTVFCALAPAAYAGPLIGKMYFKFMRIISPAAFRIMFGIHAFIPLMMDMHALLHPKIYGWLGYKVFSFLFDWTDTRWDRELKDRMFQFAPVYVSAESMRWWLGRECFAKHKCILSTKEQWTAEEKEDEAMGTLGTVQIKGRENGSALADQHGKQQQQQPGRRRLKGSTAWYNEQVCPFALWVAGNDDLVDGKRLLRRFENGREPHVKVVHSKVIEGYEHLDVIWAMDARKQVFDEVRDVLWKTCNVRDKCRVPAGCEEVEAWVSPKEQSQTEGEQSSSDAVS